MLSLIVAKADNNVIGKDNKMPWHLPQDLQYFKATTMSKPIIMGRKTFDSLGRVLPGRPHIIISRDAKLQVPEGCYAVTSLDAAIRQAQAVMPDDQNESVIIGGAQIYKEALGAGLVQRLYITEIQLTPEGDTYFPEIEAQQWKEVERVEGDGDVAHCFVTYQRI